MCARVQCGLGCTSHLYQSLFDRNLVGARWGEGEGLCAGSWGELEKAVGGGGELCMGAVSQHCEESDNRGGVHVGGTVWGEL